MKEKYFHMYGKAVDAEGAEHIVTVVGKFEQKKIAQQHIEPSSLSIDGDTREREGIIVYNTNEKIRTLKLGYSICHPSDEFDEEIGVKIAKGRINRGEFIGELASHNITMLNDDQCTLNVFGELQYIINNIDKYLPQEENDDEEIINFTNVVDEVLEEEMFGDATEEPIEGDSNYAPNYDNLPNLN